MTFLNRSRKRRFGSFLPLKLLWLLLLVLKWTSLNSSAPQHKRSIFFKIISPLYSRFFSFLLIEEESWKLWIVMIFILKNVLLEKMMNIRLSFNNIFPNVSNLGILFLNGGSSVYSHELCFVWQKVSRIHWALKNWTFLGKIMSGSWSNFRLQNCRLANNKYQRRIQIKIALARYWIEYERLPICSFLR